ncbi:sodium/potassium-transporting ATPase subunit beta-3b isoform X1 [Gouania willdenowi]|nr:sodium/potassium-transporting ATPase subunit beta-3-like isoform X1 [Gouania willdenowi]
MHARTRGPLQDVSVCVRVRVRVVCCRPTVSLISSDRATMTSHGPVQKEDVKEDREERWTDFIYNSRTGEFCGRTGRSWGLILLFYSVFYGFLTGMFSLTMFVMLQTLDPDVPRHQNLVKSPGLVIRPHVVEISYNRSEPSDYLKYVEQLHELLQKYNDSVQEKNDLCLVGEYTEQEEVKEQREKKVCQFKRSVLSQCSGLMDPFYGYGDGTPCVIVKMNRVRLYLLFIIYIYIHLVPWKQFTHINYHGNYLHTSHTQTHTHTHHLPMETIYTHTHQLPLETISTNTHISYHGNYLHTHQLLWKLFTHTSVTVETIYTHISNHGNYFHT